MNAKLRVGVIGTGSLGKEHARVYAELAMRGNLEFVGVYDASGEVAQRIASRYGIRAYPSIDALASEADAFSIVTPTDTHHEIARDLLTQGKHLLVEKPMAKTTDQAADLIRLAQSHECTLQVGHIERFNPVFQYLTESTSDPRFIEAHRLSPFPQRSTDISVVLDLMIHDLDIILEFVRSDVESVDAVGIPVLSESEDIANARIRFTNGCIANLTASRVSPEQMRKIRVFSDGPNASYLSLDYQGQQGHIYRLANEDENESSLWKKLFHSKDQTICSAFAGRKITREPVPIQREEPLKLELKSFVDCLVAQHTPLVTGESAKQALDLALTIVRQIHDQASST